MSKIEEMAQIWLAARLLNGSSGNLSVEEFRELGMDAYMTGAKAVLEEIKEALTPQKCLTDIGIEVSAEALVKTALQTINELKGD